MDKYEGILEEFSRASGIPHLKADSNQTCLIKQPSGLEVYVQLNKAQTHLILGSKLGFIPPGRYREMILKEALKANHFPYPHYGDFAFIREKDTLFLFALLPLNDLTGEKITSIYKPLSEKGAQWKEAIERGDVPSAMATSSGRRGNGMFGL